MHTVVVLNDGMSSACFLLLRQQVVSREKKDLEVMLRTFNIYIDNPCCVLTQEESKQFIHGGAPAKYEFFLKVCCRADPISTSTIVTNFMIA